jgi:hypothetical protein
MLVETRSRGLAVVVTGAPIAQIGHSHRVWS